MRYLIVSIVLLALLLGACSASSNPSPLPVVTYSTACLEKGEVSVNANPCLAPDAGFAAALGRAGISFPTAIERILAQAITAA